MKGFSLSQTRLYIPSIQEAEAGPLFTVNLGYIPGIKFKIKKIKQINLQACKQGDKMKMPTVLTLWKFVTKILSFKILFSAWCSDAQI